MLPKWTRTHWPKKNLRCRMLNASLEPGCSAKCSMYVIDGIGIIQSSLRGLPLPPDSAQRAAPSTTQCHRPRLCSCSRFGFGCCFGPCQECRSEQRDFCHNPLKHLKRASDGDWWGIKGCAIDPSMYCVWEWVSSMMIPPHVFQYVGCPMSPCRNDWNMITYDQSRLIGTTWNN